MPANQVKKRVLLLGCGYTSVWAYKYLQKHAGGLLASGEVEVVLLSDTDYHSFHGFTGEFLNGFLPLTLRHTPYQEIMPYARLIQARAVGVDSNAKTVQYQLLNSPEVQELAYDELVIGVGSADQQLSVKGLAEWGLGVKKVGGLEACREKIIHSLTQASKAGSEAEIEKYLTFAVVGGGFAAVEVCGNLQEYLESLKAHFPVLEKRGYTLHLIHAGEELLPQVNSTYGLMRRYTKNVLLKAGVSLLPNSRLAKIDENGLYLQDGRFIATVVPICALGQKVVPVDSVVPFERAADGSIVADECLRAKGFENIWVGGDIAHVSRPYFDGVCRKDALWAIKQGSRIGKNIARSLKNKKPGKFAYPGLGQTASFGKNKAILELYGIQLIGWLAWINRIGFFLYFMPSRKKAVTTFFALFKKRELLPAAACRQETLVKNITWPVRQPVEQEVV